VWSRYRESGPFEPGTPWLLRFFDRIRWYPVEAEELLELRADLAAGRLELEIEDGEFTVAAHEEFLAREAESISAFRDLQRQAFDAEREAWRQAGEFDQRPEPAAPGAEPHAALPSGAVSVEAPVSASVWQVDVNPGDRVNAGQRLLTLEAMKMETSLDSPVDGHVLDVLVGPGHQVSPGARLIVLSTNGATP
jgi:urea carboxylase